MTTSEARPSLGRALQCCLCVLLAACGGGGGGGGGALVAVEETTPPQILQPNPRRQWLLAVGVLAAGERPRLIISLRVASGCSMAIA